MNRKITEIIVHCTATRPAWMAGNKTSEKVAEVKEWHVKGRGWSDIGYHFLIDRDGTVAKGRPITRNGAHVKGHNTGTVGVSLFGGHGAAADDMFSDHFTPVQDKALRKLLADMRSIYGPVPVTGHNQYATKGCPGFIVAEWLNGPVAAPAPKPSWIAALINAIVAAFRKGK